MPPKLTHRKTEMTPPSKGVEGAPPSSSGFRYLRATVSTPRSRKDRSAPLGKNEKLEEKCRAGQPLHPYLSCTADVAVNRQPSSAEQTSFSSTALSITPAESSLARLRALASPPSLRLLSTDSPPISMSEEFPLELAQFGEISVIGSRSPSASSSLQTSSFNSDPACCLSFVKGTSARATLTALHRGGLKRYQQAAQRPLSPLNASIFRNEEEGERKRARKDNQLDELNVRRTTSVAPFTSLCGTGASASAEGGLYSNEEEVPCTSATREDAASRGLSGSMLDRLRAAPRSALTGGRNSSPLTSLAARSDTKKGRTTGTATVLTGYSVGSPWRGQLPADEVAPQDITLPHASTPSTPPQATVSSTFASRLATLRRRASSSAKEIAADRAGGAGSAIALAPTMKQPLSSSPPPWTSLMHKMRPENLVGKHPRAPSPVERGKTAEATPPVTALEMALYQTPQYCLLTSTDAGHGTSAPIPPTAIDGDLLDGEQLRRDVRRFKCEAVVPPLPRSRRGGDNAGSAQTIAAKLSFQQRAQFESASEVSSKGATVVKTKSAQRSAERRKIKSLQKLRSSVAFLSVTPDGSSGCKMGEARPTARSNAQHAKQVMEKLRSLAAPVPIGEALDDTRTHSIAPAFSSDPTALLSLHERGYPALPPSTTALHAVGRTEPFSVGAAASLPPSWSAASPFAPLASPSLLAGLREVAPRTQGKRGSSGSARQNENVDCGAPARSSEMPSHFLSSPPHGSTLFSYPTPMPTGARAATAMDPRGATTGPSAGLFSSAWAATAAMAQDRPRPGGGRSSDCIVFDTCSLLESEPGVMNLVLEKFLVGIPFTALDELDRMHKDRGNRGGTSSDKNDAAATVAGANILTEREWRRRRAHELRNWIAACLAESNSHLLVQKRTEVVEAYDRHAASSDDRILGYAVYLRERYERVYFVTEDKFLRIKASSELGKVLTYSEVRALVGMPPISTSSRPPPRGRKK